MLADLLGRLQRRSRVLRDTALMRTRFPEWLVIELEQAADDLDEAAKAACAASADTARLDWLADVDNTIANVQLPTMCVMNHMDDMRAAIDEAMRLDPEVWAEVCAADAGSAWTNC